MTRGIWSTTSTCPFLWWLSLKGSKTHSGQVSASCLRRVHRRYNRPHTVVGRLTCLCLLPQGSSRAMLDSARARKAVRGHKQTRRNEDGSPLNFPQRWTSEEHTAMRCTSGPRPSAAPAGQPSLLIKSSRKLNLQANSPKTHDF